MLRITQNTGGAKSYFTTADYYSKGQELTGRWRGEAARRLGLDGDVKQAEWDALCDNVHPQTGEQLTPRRKTDRTVGYRKSSSPRRTLLELSRFQVYR